MPMNLSELLSQRANLSPQREAFVSPEGRWTFQEFDQRCSRLARELALNGVKVGDRVAILAKNSEFLANSVFAAARVGATAVVLNWRLQEAELDYILANSEPSAFLYESEFTSVAESLMGGGARFDFVVHQGSSGIGSHYEQIVSTQEDALCEYVHVDSEAAAVIMYTSGTTGRPKGAMLSHRALIATAHSNSCTLEWNQTHRFLLIAPMFHIGGLSPLITNVVKGCLTVLLPEFDPKEVWATIAVERVSSLMSVPLMLRALLQVAKSMPVDTSSLVSVTCGASAVPRDLIEACLNIGINVQQVYGITEFCGAVTFWTPEMGVENSDSQGKPTMHAIVRVTDSETHEKLPAGEAGEIWCRGPMMFSGYWRNVIATESAIYQGWYRTGDIGCVDENGFVYVKDRLKDMVISGGENIYPAELEGVIAQLPGVAEVAVIGRPDERWGEVPVAFVVRRPNMTFEKDAVIAHCRERLAGYKCVKEVTFVETLPRNAVGKILKQRLRDV